MVKEKMNGKSGDLLRGMTEICVYVGFSEATVLKWIRERAFPAKKPDGIWIASRSAVDTWIKEVREEAV